MIAHPRSQRGHFFLVLNCLENLFHIKHLLFICYPAAPCNQATPLTLDLKVTMGTAFALFTSCSQWKTKRPKRKSTFSTLDLFSSTSECAIGGNLDRNIKFCRDLRVRPGYPNVIQEDVHHMGTGFQFTAEIVFVRKKIAHPYLMPKGA